MYFKRMPLKIVGFVGSGFAHRHIYVKVGVGAQHRAIGKTNQTRMRRLCIVGRTVVLWLGEK